jgi:hypothetical protein
MSRGRRQPKSFAPGALMDRYESRMLTEAGFLPGYPVFSKSNAEELEELLIILHALTFPQRGEYRPPERFGQPPEHTPIVRMGILVPDGLGYGEHWYTPMRVSEIRRRWRRVDGWYLTGHLVALDEDLRWYIDRRPVVSCGLHVLLHGENAYAQLAPRGVNVDLPDPPPNGDEFRWGDLSSRTLPPNPSV